MTIERFMTANPHTIGRDLTLTVAHELMRKHGVRHLPVLHGGKLVGVLSQRDLYFLETFKDVEQDKVTVEEAMTPDPFIVELTAKLGDVARTMADHKYGAAIVVESGKVVGIFTAIDALHALTAA